MSVLAPTYGFANEARVAVLLLPLLTACARTHRGESATDAAAVPSRQVGVARAPAPDAMPSTSSTTSAAPSAQVAAPPALEQSAVVEAACRRVGVNPFPVSHQGPKLGRRPPVACDSEALYYGIGVPQDFVRARQCAEAESAAGDAPVIGGAGVLMMIYANGKSVPVDFHRALRFACEYGGAPAELELRVARLERARKTGTLARGFDVCDDITSGYMQGFCAGHHERIDAVTRNARKATLASRLPRAELGRLERAAKAFFDARESNEVDTSGSGRAAFQLEERAQLEDRFLTALEQLGDPKFLPPGGDAEAVEAKLNRVYSRLAKCPALGKWEVSGTITLDGIRKTQRLWLPYREAWLALAAAVRPETKRDPWRVWVTEERIGMLGNLLPGGC